MTKPVVALFLALAGIFMIDQNIKTLFLEGFRYYTDCIDLTLVYNKGVAFSMFAFLKSWLKWVQLVLIFGVLVYVLRLKKACYMLPAGILVGAGLSNVYDRFIHPGVVDYVYWHCGFDFAIFNFADVMIDVAVVWILLLNLKPKWCEAMQRKFSEKTG